MSDEIVIYTLSEARVGTSRHLPGMVLLSITSGQATTHYAMSVDDLAGLAERLRQDALLLKG